MFEGGTKFGYHFIGEYKACPRRWLLHYGYGLEKKGSDLAPLFGSAVHKYVELFYKHNIDCFGEAVKVLEPLHDVDVEAWHEAEDRLNRAAEALNPVLAEDLDHYDIEPEMVLEEKLDGQFPFTMRLDALKRNKATGVYRIGEFKTTGYSLNGMLEDVFLDDQATAYTWGAKQHGIDVEGVEVTVVYQKGSVTKIGRELIYRSNKDCAIFERENTVWFSTVQQSYEALIVNFLADPCSLFPSNRGACSNFCPYTTICRGFDPLAATPDGFDRGEWPNKEAFLGSNK